MKIKIKQQDAVLLANLTHGIAFCSWRIGRLNAPKKFENGQ
jgi:hypothetical protein